MRFNDRVAVELAGHPIYWYGVMVALGFLAGYAVMYWRAGRLTFPRERLSDLVMAAMIGGVGGARLWFVVMHWDIYGQDLARIVRIDEGGLVFYGGFLGAALAMVWWSRLFKLSVSTVADMAAVGLPLGHAFGRVGCLLNGCCFGKPTSMPFGVAYERQMFPGVWEMQLDQGLISPERLPELMDAATMRLYALPVMPVQALLGLGNLLVAGILLGVAPHWRQPGRLFALFMVLYPVNRFIWEFWRGDYATRPLGLTPAQWVSLVILPVGLYLLWSYRRAAPTPPTPSPASSTPPAA